MDWTDLKAYVGASSTDDAYVEECWDTSKDLVASYIASTKVPVGVLKRCYLEVGSELFNRRNAPMGVAQYATYDGAPLNTARDPLVGVYPLLNRYMVRFG
jgi:hypothetical protein